MRFRHEKKYVINEHTAAILRARTIGVMHPDKHGSSYVVNNLYIDDRYDSFYHGSYYGRLIRDKYRLRFYNCDKSFIRLERKHKEGYLAYKDTIQVSEEQYEQIRSGNMNFILKEDAPIWQTLANIHRLKILRPTAIFAYKREAYVYDAGNVRFTFDSPPFDFGEPIPLAYEPLAMTYGKEEYAPILLEVKYNNFLPEVIQRLLNGLPLAQTSMSKYCIVRERGVLRYGATS
ncbi:MAG: polyphosphate polymerase domain-containing protein [Defluviitaleaceae bacterium]|nr:polyphosphate polymerase domain-containing protein [Defluviitaleaceae bacterium]